jgi:hypothetical protein
MMVATAVDVETGVQTIVVVVGVRDVERED